MNKKTITCSRAYTAPSASYLQMDLEGVIAQSVHGVYLDDMDANELYDDFGDE